MSIRHDLALRFALLKVLMGELGDAKSVADCEVRDTWRPGDRLSALLPGDVLLGAVSLEKGRVTANVTDEDSYQAWVEKTHPGEIETVTTTRVNPEFTARMKSAARHLGTNVDPATGEEIPGVTVRVGEPFPKVTLTADARNAVAKAWRAGELAEIVGGLLALEGGQ